MKGILKKWFIDGLSYMALGIFCSLIIGLILDTVGQQTLVKQLDLSMLSEIGKVAMSLTGAAIGGAMAYGFKSKPLVLFSAIIVGYLAYDTYSGGPVGAYLATLVVYEASKLYASRTSIDIIITPLLSLLIGSGVAKFVGPFLNEVMQSIGRVIVASTEQQPLVMGILVAVIVGLTLTAPISSAAICLMLNLEGLAAGAATIGCVCQMIGFSVNSYRDNGLSGLISIGIGTSMLQEPNILKNPYIILPPTLASALIAPIMTTLFPMYNNAIGAGMGTSGLVGPLMTIRVMDASIETYILIGIFYFMLPAIVSFTIYSLMMKIGLIRKGDHTIQIVE